MRHAGALPVLYGLLVPMGKGIMRTQQSVLLCQSAPDRIKENQP
jgi:hypothetical protein